MVAEAFSFLPAAKRGGAENHGGFVRALRDREELQVAAFEFGGQAFVLGLTPTLAKAPANAFARSSRSEATRSDWCCCFFLTTNRCCAASVVPPDGRRGIAVAIEAWRLRAPSRRVVRPSGSPRIPVTKCFRGMGAWGLAPTSKRTFSLEVAEGLEDKRRR